jgi:hypothetical protein
VPNLKDFLLQYGGGPLQSNAWWTLYLSELMSIMIQLCEHVAHLYIYLGCHAKNIIYSRLHAGADTRKTSRADRTRAQSSTTRPKAGVEPTRYNAVMASAPPRGGVLQGTAASA